MARHAINVLLDTKDITEAAIAFLRIVSMNFQGAKHAQLFKISMSARSVSKVLQETIALNVRPATSRKAKTISAMFVTMVTSAQRTVLMLVSRQLVTTFLSIAPSAINTCKRAPHAQKVMLLDQRAAECVILVWKAM